MNPSIKNSNIRALLFGISKSILKVIQLRVEGLETEKNSFSSLLQ